jgi:xanthine/uracil permease
MTDPSPVGRLLDSVVGIAAPTLGLITSMQEQLEYGLRVASLIVGLVVGLLAVWRHFK